ncbi:hypothetical protein AALO_G00082900 [Alosa alosa]|uniref:Uncharacterized protein n=1 Tax=Alosa alosa TaxID=278164 RepID=A0AAV6GZU5_9TELE|nr:hypothetical protein AALO_G00082900 [Alosa alosa]
MRATLTALGKSVAQGSHRGAERMIHQVTRRITACLTSQKTQQQSGSTPENRSLASDVANTTGEVMAVVIQTMESHLDDQEDQHAKEVLSTMAATVKMMTETDSAALEHPHDLMDISHLKGQSQTQKEVRSSSRHTTQSIDKLSDREFQEKARNAISDVLIKRFPGSTTQLTRPSSAVIDQSNHCRDENGGTPSVSVADLAASTITELFVEEMMYMVESTENFIEKEPTHDENTDTTDSSLPLLDSDEYSCLVTMLILRLLSKIKDQQLVSADLIDVTRDLIERVLLEFTDVSRSATHPKNAKVHKVYRIVYDYLMKGLGTTTALKAIETQDLSFDQLLIMALTKQLLHTCDTQDPTTQKTPRPEKTPKLKINLKRHKLGNANVSPVQEDQDTNPCEGTSAPLLLRMVLHQSLTTALPSARCFHAAR